MRPTPQPFAAVRPEPEPARDVGGPGLRKCHDDRVAKVLHDWAERRGITSAELAEVLGVSATLVRKLRRAGEDGKPVHASDILRLPSRYRRQLLDLLEAEFDRAVNHG